MWSLPVNTSKTKCVAYKKGGKIGKLDKWTFENVPLQTVNTFKYLGFTLGNSGKFKQSVAAIADQSQIAMFNMKSFLQNYPDLDLKTQ